MPQKKKKNKKVHKKKHLNQSNKTIIYQSIPNYSSSQSGGHQNNKIVPFGPQQQQETRTDNLVGDLVSRLIGKIETDKTQQTQGCHALHHWFDRQGKEGGSDLLGARATIRASSRSRRTRISRVQGTGELANRFRPQSLLVRRAPPARPYLTPYHSAWVRVFTYGDMRGK